MMRRGCDSGPRIRSGLVRIRTIVVFAAGYYLGAKAGRARYVQLRQVTDKVLASPQVQRARAVADLAVERVRDTLED
jgi:hypothetical protein